MSETKDNEPSTKHKAQSSKARPGKWLAYALLLLAAFSFRIWIALRLANDSPEDGKVYAQMARNLLEQHVYSHAHEPPFQPSLIRLPGYSLFLAAIYSICGHWNNTAVRVVQAVLDTLTCALLALLAYYWEPNQQRKHVASLAALALAAVCPFTVIYVATILTETWASLFAIGLCLLATLAFRAASFKGSLVYWLSAGLIAGVSVFFRPDSGLFVAAVGLTLVITNLLPQSNANKSTPLPRRFFKVVAQGAVLSAAFAVVLVPWTVRNWREFHLFQPLSPQHGEMPGEFVPRGYYKWLRTWVDDRKYTEPMLWSLFESEIDIEQLPASAFDSAEEKARVTALLEQYNDPPEQEEHGSIDQGTTGADSTVAPTEPAPSPKQSASPEADDDTQNAQEQTEAETPVAEEPPDMTPALDAEFGKIASERIARQPLRYYFWLPLKRARSLWFGAHSDYYPFSGELFPLADLNHKTRQHIWLPLFAALVWLYTLLGVAGGWRLLRSKEFASRRWLLLVFLMIFFRLAFFSTMENPEPRYTVEIFPFLAILGGLAISRLRKLREN